MADDMMYILDQHAADERVQLEMLQRATVDLNGLPLPGGVERRRLRSATPLSLSSRESALIDRFKAKLQAWGWEVVTHNRGMHGAEDRMLVAIPVVASVELREPAMLEYVEALVATGGGSTLAPPAVGRVLASKACRRAVMFGDVLELPQCQVILSSLADCEMPLQCAHGRPTIVPVLSLRDLRTAWATAQG